MTIFPIEAEITTACDLLINQYNISVQLLNKLYNNDNRELSCFSNPETKIKLEG